MNAFVDTNVSISYTFLIDPHNYKSNLIFNKYKQTFWSDYVEKEYNKVLNSKRKILIKFYENLLKDFKKGFPFKISLTNLKKYVEENYSPNDNKQIKSSLDSFWNRYINETYPSLDNIFTSINNCINDLNYGIYMRKNKLINNIEKTEKRNKKYNLLNKKLLNEGIHQPDNIIILDAHDFNLNVITLDFITFDKNMYKCCNKLKNELKFNNILGLNDFY